MGAKLVPVLEGLSLITQQKQPSAVLLDLQKASGHIAQEDLVFLGLQDGGIPFFGAPCQESIAEIVEATGAEVQCTATLRILVFDPLLEDIRNACCWPTAKGSHAEVLAAPGHHQAQGVRACASSRDAT